MQGNKCLNLAAKSGKSRIKSGTGRLRIALLLLAGILLIPSVVSAALTVQFTSSPPTGLFVNQAGSWTVQISNPDASAVNSITLTATLPTGYVVTAAGGGSETAGPPHTLVWSIATLAGNASTTRTFSARPNCSAASSASTTAQIQYGATTLSTSVSTSVLPLSISFLSGSSSLSIGQEGTWVVRVQNPYSVTATGATIVATLPLGMRVSALGGGSLGAGPPQTITWTNRTINASGFLDLTYKAIPNCGADSSLAMSAYANCPVNSAVSGTISVKTPSISINQTSGGLSSPIVHKNDTIVWDIDIANGGTGDLVNGLAITDTLGAGYSFVSLTQSDGTTPVSYSGSWSTGASWNSGAIASGVTKRFKLRVTVANCVGFTNGITGTWGDGLSTCSSITSSSSVLFLKQLPDLAVTVTPFTNGAYCGYAADSTRSTIRVENTGPGPANNFLLGVQGLPADWGVKTIVVATGGAGSVSWDNTNKRFIISSITGLSGARPVVEFSFTTGPIGPCSPTISANLVFTSDFQDECGVPGLPPTVGPYTYSVDASGLPGVAMELTGPLSANVGQTGLTYSLTATYTAPLGPASMAFDIVYNYPSAFTINNAGGGTVDLSGHTITWSGITMTTSGPGNVVTRTVLMDAPTSPCSSESDFTYSANASSVNPYTNCLGCTSTITASKEFSTSMNSYAGPLLSSTKTVLYWNSVMGSFDNDRRTAEVNTDIQYTTTFNFDPEPGNAPSTWSNTDGLGLGHNITLYDQAQFSQSFVSIDDVKVNGVSYTTGMPAASFPGTPLNLGYLDATAAPKPNAGAILEVTYRLHTTAITENEGPDYTRITVPGYPPSCVSQDYFYVAANVKIGETQVSIDTGTGSPVRTDVGETQLFRMTLNGNDFPIYDPKLTLDTKGNYTLVVDGSHPVTFYNFIDFSGASVSAPALTNPSTNKYVWDFAGTDIQSNAPYITFYMQKTCDISSSTWNGTLNYNTRLNNGTLPGLLNSSEDRAPEVTRKASLDIQFQPAIVTAYDKYPEFTVVIWNNGSGTAFNFEEHMHNGAALQYLSYAVPLGTPPDAPPTIHGDGGISFYYATIPPGEKRYLTIREKLLSCTGLNVTAHSTWGGTEALPCGSITNVININIPPSPSLITTHTIDHNVDYCGRESIFNVEAKNTGIANLYNLKIVETMAPGLTDSGVSSEIYTISSGSLSGAPTRTTSGTVATGITITWDFSSVLPVDSYGDKVFVPDTRINVQYSAYIADCAGAQAYSGGSKRFTAYMTADSPCSAEAGGSVISSPVLNLYTSAANPTISIVKAHMNVTKGESSYTTGFFVADKDDIISWRITLASIGDYIASNVRLTDSLTPNSSYVASWTTLDGSANSWDPTGGSILSLGDMGPGTSHVIVFRTKVDSCSSDQTNTATTTWGCLTGCSGTAPATERTASATATMRAQPTLSLAIATVTNTQTTRNYFVTDGGTIQFTITNTGSRATLAAGQYLSLMLPRGFNFDNTVTPVITTSNPLHGTLNANPSYITDNAAGFAGALGELRWAMNKIDYIDTNETITLTVNFQADGVYLDTTCAGAGPLSEQTLIPTTVQTASMTYNNACGSAYLVTSNSITIDPKQPNLDVTAFPTLPVIQPGDTAKTITLTFKNNGDELAKNIGYYNSVSGVDQRLVINYGPGYSLVPAGVTNNTGGTLTAPSGNQITIRNMNNLAVGASYTVVLAFTIVGSGARPITDYWVDAEIKGVSLRRDGSVTDTRSVPGGCYLYSDDYLKVDASEGILVLRPNNTGTGKPCNQVSYYHTLRNNGDTESIFDLTATSSQGWRYLFYKVDSTGTITGNPVSSITLGAKDSGTDSQAFVVRLFIPCTQAENTVDTTSITATYRADTQVTRTVTDTTMVASRLFIKKEARNFTTSGTFSDTAQGLPGDIIEYRITFKNYSIVDVKSVLISDPIPPFSTLITTAYNDGSTDFSVKLSFVFADASFDCYTNATTPYVIVDLNSLVSGCLATHSSGGLAIFRSGESGALYYQVRINP